MKKCDCQQITELTKCLNKRFINPQIRSIRKTEI